MKITEIKLRKVTGTMETKGQFWEDRLVQPIDVYLEYRQRGPGQWANQIDANHIRIVAYFCEVRTDEGVTGTGGPLTDIQAFIITKTIAPIIIGKDPLATELIWDQVHRLMVHGRQGEAMMAFSAVDCALWDLKGRYFKTPVYKLIGGPTRTEVPAYDSMLGWSVTDMALVRERARAAKAAGYKAQKWFFLYGPASGVDGMKKNALLVKTIREAIGDEDEVMLDCWQSWNYPYAIAMADMIREYRLYWLEEIAMPDRIDTYKAIKDKISIPLSGAEHEYTRWGFKRFIDEKALDILQPDIYWAGGLSEVLKIAAYATVHDLITIPHGHSSPAGLHFSVTQSPVHTPYQEYLVKWNDIHQHFLKHPVKPKNGVIGLPTQPGIGMDLDPAKIEKEEDPKF